MLIACDYSLAYLGGAQIALTRQAHALAQAGHQVFVLAPDADQVQWAHAGIRAVPLASKYTLPALQLPLFRFSAKLAASVGGLLRSTAINAVLLHSEFGLAATVSTEARARRIPVLHTVHTFFWRGPRGAAAFTPVVRAFHRHTTTLPWPHIRLARRSLDSALRQITLALALTADVVISPSRHQAERLRAAQLNRVEVVSNVTEPCPEPAPLPPTDTLRVAWIGRFAPEKRLDTALGGIATATLSRPAELWVAGGTPNARQRRTGGERVTWLGRLGEPQIAELIDNCHAVLLTSHGFDNQPMVALEAFSRGRPVIVVDRVLAGEFGAAAILCDTPETAGVRRTIELLAREPERLSQAARSAAALAAAASGAAHAAQISQLVATFTRP